MVLLKLTEVVNYAVNSCRYWGSSRHLFKNLTKDLHQAQFVEICYLDIVQGNIRPCLEELCKNAPHQDLLAPETVIKSDMLTTEEVKRHSIRLVSE